MTRQLEGQQGCCLDDLVAAVLADSCEVGNFTPAGGT